MLASLWAGPAESSPPCTHTSALCGSCHLGSPERNQDAASSSAPQEPHDRFPRPQVQPSDSLEPEFSRKSQALLKHWREKVFALMVQLKAQELEHGACVQQLKGQVTWRSSSPWLSLFPLHKGWHLVNQRYRVAATSWEQP